MKFLLTAAAVIAIAVAGPTQRGLVTPDVAGPAPVPEFLEVNSGPTFVDTEGPGAPGVIDNFVPVANDPTLVDPVAPGLPAIIDNSVPVVDKPNLIQPAPAPAEVVEVPVSGNAHTIQIIVNINQVPESNPGNPLPVMPIMPAPIVDDEQVVVDPVNIVDAPASPVQVVDVSPVQVVDTVPVVMEPVVIGTPVLPSPVVILPDELN